METEEIYRQELERRERSMGPDHPDVADSLNNLAMFYYQAGRYSDAEPLYKRGLAIREKTLGPDNPEVAINAHNLAVLYYDEQRYSDAEPLFLRSRTILERASPNYPADLARTLNTLGALYYAQRRYIEAEAALRDAVRAREAALGPYHIQVAVTLDNHAAVLRQLGRDAKAQTVESRASAIRAGQGQATAAPPAAISGTGRGQVFISYAHADNESADPSKRWLDRLREQLAPLDYQGLVHAWSDREIEMGEDWHQRIQASLDQVKAAVLLVSPAFLASKFIRNSELPVLLKNAKDRGLVIIPIIVRYCLFAETRFKYPDPANGPQELTLSSIQSANTLDKPLSTMSESEQDQVLLRVAQKLLTIL